MNIQEPFSNMGLNPLDKNPYLTLTKNYEEQIRTSQEKNKNNSIKSIWHTSIIDEEPSKQINTISFRANNFNTWHLFILPKRSQFISHPAFPPPRSKTGQLLKVNRFFDLPKSNCVSSDSYTIVKANNCLWTEKIDNGLVVLMKASQNEKVHFLGLVHINKNSSLFSAALMDLKMRIKEGLIDVFITGGDSKIQKIQDQYFQIKKLLSQIARYTRFYPCNIQIQEIEDLSKNKNNLFSDFQITSSQLINIKGQETRVKTTKTVEAKIDFVGFDLVNQPFQILNIELEEQKQQSD